MHIGVDALALRQRFIERERADDRTQRSTGQRADGNAEVGNAEQRLLGIDDLREDRRVDRDHHVVSRDHFLPVAGNGDLAHVDALQTVDERSDDHQTGLVRLAVLAQALDDTDLTLLHDVDHVLQHHQQDAERQNGDDETTDGE